MEEKWLPESLLAGTGWTPGIVLCLRTLLGTDGVPMFREVMAQKMGTTERSIFRWEHGLAQVSTMFGRSLARFAIANLDAEQLAALAAFAETEK
jgi:hypothetical protein